MSGKIQFECPEHGPYLQSIRMNRAGRQGCRSCKSKMLTKALLFSEEKFLEMLAEVHGDRYRIQEGSYEGMRSRIRAICHRHGEWQPLAGNLVSGHGCPRCAIEDREPIGPLVKFSEVLDRAQEVHGNEYAYVEESYTGIAQKMEIICPRHGLFRPVVNHHLRGQRCPVCSRGLSHGEHTIKQVLEKMRVSYSPQFTPDLRGPRGGKLRFDFLIRPITLSDFLVEFDGEQHRRPVTWSGDPLERFHQILTVDNIKDEWALASGISLYRLREEDLLLLTEVGSINDLLAAVSHRAVTWEGVSAREHQLRT